MTSTSLVMISRSCIPTPRFLPLFFRPLANSLCSISWGNCGLKGRCRAALVPTRAPTRVLHTVDANRPSARAMQDGVPLALLHFFQQLTDFHCGRRKDRKSTRLNSSHSQISYAVFCLKKKNIYKCTL